VKAIWKYQVTGDHTQTLEMPQGAQILTVQVQQGEPVLWALVDPALPKEKREFFIVGTGWPIDGGLGQYVGTFQIMEGSLVFHIFEAPR